MRFNFDLKEDNSFSDPLTSPSPATPAEDVQWVPLQSHPLFTAAGGRTASSSSSSRMVKNLLAWDGASRLYFWDSQKRCLHRISVKLGEPDSGSILAASPSKVLRADVQLDFEIYKISINRNGSAILLSGLEGLWVMYLYGRTSVKENTTVCRTVSIGSEIYFDRGNLIRTLQVSWHPHSDTHLGILSSDSVFRIFNLSWSIHQPEQEYFLQPVERGSAHSASSICPVDFSFGGDHLWDRFSVFVLFSDGSTYILCPVVPFGSIYKREALMEMYTDMKTIGTKSSTSKQTSNCNMAISWLEATFPELSPQTVEGGNLFSLKAQPYAFMDSSVSLQGPLHNLCHSVKKDSQIQIADTEGRAVSLLYNLVSKDSVLVTAWSSGQLQIDALADEIQPVWKVGTRPRLSVDSYDRLLGVAMICESVSSDLSFLKSDHTPDRTDWLGYPPPLLRLAIVDLALLGKNSPFIRMFIDPLMPERIYCLHEGGIDSIVLHFLPFTSQTNNKESTRRPPSVHPVISTYQGDASPVPPLCGFLALADSFGDSWTVGLTSSCECIVLQMESWNLLLPPVVDKEKEPTSLEDLNDAESSTIISKELLSGPKLVLLPPSSPNLRSVAADSIEGRSTLHQYFKLFHENYMEYAHKVYFELEHHAPHLRKIIDDQHSRLQKALGKLSEVEEKQEKIEGQIANAVQFHNVLEERLVKLRNLPGTHKKPLSKAEREFKSEIDRFTGVELDALRSTIQAVSARLKRVAQSPEGSSMDKRGRMTVMRKSRIPEGEISQLKSSLEKLSLINSENTKKLKLVESALRSQETNDQ
ncbi:hypothetical protein M9H77_10867 [Catharanthus roseus]|uniref:Uncharacterized protein n=1 Tax=Catharanthus roseus TaxID=4058 RepID=A0ACC0BD07_CATRO|nr:hypothetical protein M9H77_10867 [Catharanthus roseus]